MNSYKSGLLPFGSPVKPAAWRDLSVVETVQRPSAAVTAEPSSSELYTSRSTAPVPSVSSEALLSDVRLQAAQILNEAAAEAESAVDAARQEGYESGRQEGLAAGMAELEAQRAQLRQEEETLTERLDLLRQSAEAEARAIRAQAELEAQALLQQVQEKASAIAAEAQAEQKRRLDEAQAAVVDLAVTAAIRLVQGHLALKPSAIVAMVAAGLRRLKDTNCTARVSLHDLPLLEAQRSVLERELGAGHLQLQPDASMTPGSYMIQSPQGQIDARIDSQATSLRSALAAALGEE